MSTGRKILIALCMIGIFAAGGATGAFVTLRVLKNRIVDRGPLVKFSERFLGHLTKELELTPEQHDQVEKILREGTDKLSTLRRESMREGAASIREMNQRISAVLTPEQQPKFEELLNRQRERIRKFQQGRNERHGGPDSPPDGPAGEPPPPPPGSNP